MSNLKKITKNYVFNLSYSILTLIIPLITTPYISDTLLPAGVGQYSFTYSISNYFCFFSQLGIGLYAQREIAKIQGDKYNQSILFFEVMIFKFVTTFIACSIFTVLCGLNFFGEYSILMLYWIFNIVAQFFDIAFLFQGNEDFEKIVLRNVIIKVLGIFVIFAFVKEENDVWIYILSTSLSALIGVMVTWTYIPKYIVSVKIKELHVLRHFKPTIILFAPTIASSLAGYLDRTIMGLVIEGTNDAGANLADVEIGLYEQTDKIIKLCTSIFTALGAVMLPRNANAATKDIFQVKKNIDNGLRFSLMISVPIMFGLIAVAHLLVPWFLGNEFLKCIYYIQVYSPMMIFLSFDNIYGYQYLMAIGKEKKYTLALLVGLVINSILNVVVIPHLLGLGAIICTLIAELSIVLVLMYFSRDIISIKKIYLDVYKYFIAAILMFSCVYFVGKRINASMYNTFLIIICGVIIYFSILILLKDGLIMAFFSKYLKKNGGNSEYR